MPKKKSARRRRRGAAVYTPVAILFIAIVTIFGISVFFRITDIEIKGAEKYNAQQIQSVSGIKDGDNLIFIDKAAIAKSLSQNLPYLSEITVEKVIPNRIVIRVTESKPVAAIQYGGDWWIIDQKARVLEKTDTAGLSGKIRVTGLTPKAVGEGLVVTVDKSDDTRLRYLTNILSALKDAGLSDKVSALDVSNTAYVTLEWGAHFTVLFGNGENAPYKVERVTKIISQLDSDERGKIDVSSDENAARFIPE
jgi:cell division protein FtsQ